jgi:hypothetical protein
MQLPDLGEQSLEELVVDARTISDSVERHSEPRPHHRAEAEMAAAGDVVYET